MDNKKRKGLWSRDMTEGEFILFGIIAISMPFVVPCLMHYLLGVG